VQLPSARRSEPVRADPKGAPERAADSSLMV
jgi:hypothetical protein